MNPISSHKDRHNNIGYGTIGFDVLNKVVHNKRLEGIPFILETPWVNRNEKDEYPPYKFEIENFRNNKFVDFINK
jgi:deoxyribonuclease-4